MSGRTPLPAAEPRPLPVAEPRPLRAAAPDRAMLAMTWAAWFGSRPDATIAALRNRHASAASAQAAAHAASSAVRQLLHLADLPGTTPEAAAIARALVDGHALVRIPPLLASVVDASERERAALALAAREAAQTDVSPAASEAAAFVIAYLVGTHLTRDGRHVRFDAGDAGFIRAVLVALGLPADTYRAQLDPLLADTAA